jgi:hypothetical protein
MSNTVKYNLINDLSERDGNEYTFMKKDPPTISSLFLTKLQNPLLGNLIRFPILYKVVASNTSIYSFQPPTYKLF